jgi:hypothetical protein
MSGVWLATGVAGLAAALPLLACTARPSPRDVPALLTSPTAESRAELVRAVSRALDGMPVTLADDALTREDTLLVDRTTRRDASGVPLDGRRTGRPERFHLVASGADCVLVHEATGRRFSLHAATCAPR